MGIRNRLSRIRTQRNQDNATAPALQIIAGDTTEFFVSASILEQLSQGELGGPIQEQFHLLDELVENGQAAPTANGFQVAADVLALLSDSETQSLGLPARYRGEFAVTSKGHSFEADFSVIIGPKVGGGIGSYHRSGPIITVLAEDYLLSPAALRAFAAIESHVKRRNLGSNDETSNLRLVAELQIAAELDEVASSNLGSKRELDLGLSILRNFKTHIPKSVSVLIDPQPDGSLILEPDLGGSFSRDKIAGRWHQVDQSHGSNHCSEQRSAVLRVENDLILLEEKPLRAVRELRTSPRIAASDAVDFLRAPGSFLDPDVFGTDPSFSLRVKGLGIVAPLTFEEVNESGLDWFDSFDRVRNPEQLIKDINSFADHSRVSERVRELHEEEESILIHDQRLYDISDESLVQRVLEESRTRLTQIASGLATESEVRPTPAQPVSVGLHLHDYTGAAGELRKIARDATGQHIPLSPSVIRQPLPHQISGISWLSGLMRASLGSPETTSKIQGAVLADDMGLGKTYVVLASLADFIEQQRLTYGNALPTLIVMPVALINNWLKEIEGTFGSLRGSFDNIVVLHGEGLSHYRIGPKQKETIVDQSDLDSDGMVLEDRIRTHLRVGPKWGEQRLDLPNTLVLTNYETLSSYQVSLGQVEWGLVALDEAQEIKNPSVLKSRAAKALKARFKLLATGTPVENSLKDFWSIFDTAQPGLLGTWADFRSAWVTPMKEALGESKLELGQKLRSEVGDFMLRRIKDDHLTGLMPKRVHYLRQAMPNAQRTAYDKVIETFRSRGAGRSLALKTLHDLADVSLHPQLYYQGVLHQSHRFEDSARLSVTLTTVLKDIQAADEKVIIFIKTKEFQRYVRACVQREFGVQPGLVNGDVSPGSTGDSRMARIRAFQDSQGFDVIVMSPLAAGVGYTITEANHVIHLERHWNPAKESQATDRVHRIGQDKQVHVYYPMAIHPGLDSFDVNIDRLLSQKIALSDAVIVPEDITDQFTKLLN